MQVLFFEQEKGSKANNHRTLAQELLSRGKQTPVTRDDLSKSKLGPDEQSRKADGMRKTPATEGSTRDHQKVRRPDKKSQLELAKKVVRGEIEEVQLEKGKEAKEEGSSGSKLDPKKIMQSRSRSDHGRDKGRDR